MDERLRQAWTGIIRGDDHDAHMAAVGQAQANAELVAQLFREHPPAPDARVLFAGAGTGQMFDYVPPDLLAPYITTFADINSAYLEALRARLRRFPRLRFETVLDDIERSRLAPGFALAVAVLVLEHVEWRAAVASLCALAERVFIVLQENPPELATALTRSRPAVGSMKVFEHLDACLVPAGEAEEEFMRHGFRLYSTCERAVLDRKKMVGQEYRREAAGGLAT